MSWEIFLRLKPNTLSISIKYIKSEADIVFQVVDPCLIGRTSFFMYTYFFADIFASITRINKDNQVCQEYDTKI